VLEIPLLKPKRMELFLRGLKPSNIADNLKFKSMNSLKFFKSQFLKNFLKFLVCNLFCFEKGLSLKNGFFKRFEKRL